MMNFQRSVRPLTSEERKLLAMALEEARSRGIRLDGETLELVRKKEVRWPLDAAGYFIRRDGHRYKPSERHRKFIESTARNTLLYGPRGCGKTGAGAQKAMKKIMQGESGIIMNPDFENLKISTWPEFRDWIPWNMVVQSQRHRQYPSWQPHQPFVLTFINGSVVYIKGGKESSSSRGPNVNWFWYDEGGRDETGLAWQITNAGVRVGNFPQAWCTETPRTMEHWSYKFFVEKNVSDEELREFEKVTKGGRILIEAFHATREDNQANLDSAYYANLAASYPSGWLRAQEYDGEVAAEGEKVGDRTWFKGRITDTPPETASKRVRFWDLAATEKKSSKDDPDETCGTLVSKFDASLDENSATVKGHENVEFNQPNFCIEDQVAGFWNWNRLVEAILNTARYDGPMVEVRIEQEPGSGGKNQIASIRSEFAKYPELAHHTVKEVRARDVGDRVLAANSYWFGVAAQGRMWVVKGGWNEKFFSQLDGFTQTLHDDRITPVTGAMYVLSPFKTWKKVPFIHI